MTAPARPPDEAARLEALSALEVLGTGPEAEFDALTRLAAQLCGTKVSVVSLVDASVVWAKSNVGVEEHFPSEHGQFFHRAPRDLTFCAHAILEPRLMEVPDLAEDPRFADNPAVAGEPRLRFYAGAPLQTGEGHAIGTLCVMDTEPRRLRPDQREALEILSRQVMANLRARARAKDLDIALKAAQGLAEQRAGTLAFLGHELRNALAALLALTEAWMEGRQDADRGSLELAHTCAAEAVGLLNTVLDHARGEAGQLRLEPRPFDLRAALARAVDLARPRATARGLALRLDVEDGLPARLLGDEARLHQIWLNLLGNALKFTERGGITLRARRSGDRVAVTVEDTGPGIPPDLLARLFQPFQQAEGGFGRAGGSGLGLAICRQLAELMGGSIEAANLPGGGCRFTLTVPLPDAGPEAGSRPPRPLRILAAEDNALARRLLGELLEAEGHAVRAVPTGAEAVRALAEEAFDVVLLDCRMPVMDGFEATEAIRRMPGERSRVPILGLTGERGPQELEVGRRAGMNALLEKPVGRAGLREALRAWTGG
ncbi:MAG: ATP-binding protein [Holophagaceae bacterium]